MNSTHEARARAALLAELGDWKRRAAEIPTLERRLDARASELVSLRERLDARASELVDLRRRFDTTASDHQQISVALAQAKTSSEQLAQDVERLQDQLDAAEQQVRASSAREKSLRAEIELRERENRQQIEELRSRLQRQYDLRWNRLGSRLRLLRTQPRRIVTAPARRVRMKLRGNRPVVDQNLPSRPRTKVPAQRLPFDEPLDRFLATGLLAGVRMNDLDQFGDSHRVDQVIDRLLSSGSGEEIQQLALRSSVNGDISRLVDRLELAGLGAITAPTMKRIVDALQGIGDIERPVRLLERPDAPSSEQLNTFLERRRREIDIIANGVNVSTPHITAPSGETSADALYLLHNSLPHRSGGYATRTHGLLTNLNWSGHTTIGVTRPGFPTHGGSTFQQADDVDPVDVIDGVTYRRLLGPVTSLPRSDLDGFVQTYASLLAPIIDEYRPAVLHAASNWWNGHSANAIARAIDVPSVYEVRGLWEVTRGSRQTSWLHSDIYQLDARYEADAAKGADRVIAITGGLRDELIKRGVDGDKISLVPNAVDTERFATVKRNEELIERLDLAGRVVIGFVGSMTFYEGLDDLIEAVALVDRRSSIDLAVLFVGDGPVEQELRERAVECGVDHLCRFVGRVPHDSVTDYLSVIDVTPFPRKPLPVCEMVSPLKPLESMAAGIPVIVSAVQALAEMVPNDSCGVVVPRSDVQSLADAIENLAGDPELRATLASNAREWVQAERSWAVIAQRVGRLYDELKTA